MPSRTPNIPKVWENRIFSRTFQNAIHREATTQAEAQNIQTQSKSVVSKDVEAEKTAKKQQIVPSTHKQNSTKKTDDMTTSPEKDTKNNTIPQCSSSAEHSFVNENNFDKVTAPSESSHEDDKMSIASDTSSDKNAQLEIKMAAEAQAYQLDSKLTTLMAEKRKDEPETAQVQKQPTLSTGVHHTPNLWLEKKVTTTSTREVSAVTSSSESSEFLFLPLERAASGIKPLPNSTEAEELEQAARNKLKKEKRAIAEAKLAVSEAKLDEFEAKLCARHAKINERHANLCYRRALINESEEQLLILESGLDENLEKYRERERRIKNRQKRAKQEEIRLQIIETGLKKREANISQKFESFEKRKKMLEENEAIVPLMDSIIAENRKDIDQRSHSESCTERERHKPTINMSKEKASPEIIEPKTPPPDELMTLEGPIIRRNKGLKNNWKRHSSYDGEMVLKSNPTAIPLTQTGTLLKQRSKGIMGLWL